MRVFVCHVLFLATVAASLSEALVSPSKWERNGMLARALSVPSISTSSTAMFVQTATKPNVDVDITAEETNANINLDFAPFDDNCFPGRDENDRYRCDSSVYFWRDFQNTEVPTQVFDTEKAETTRANGDQPHSVQDNIRDMAAVAQRFVTAERASSSYFVRHIGRTGYFAINALLGDAAFRFSQRNSNDGKAKEGPIIEGPTKGPLPMGMSSQMASRLVLETLLCYEEDYFEYVAKGLYREPWDMATLNHRQSNPFNVIDQTNRFVREAVGTLGRRSRATQEDKEVRFFKSNKSKAAAMVTSGGTKLYPEYYQTAFHYQGEGKWLTEKCSTFHSMAFLLSKVREATITVQNSLTHYLGSFWAILCRLSVDSCVTQCFLNAKQSWDDFRVDVDRFRQCLRDLDRNIVLGTARFHATYEFAAPYKLGQEIRRQRSAHEGLGGCLWDGTIHDLCP